MKNGIDRSGLMKEVQQVAKQRINEGKATTHKEAYKQMKEEGLWTKLIDKFRTKPNVPPVEVKTESQKKASKGFPWNTQEESLLSNDTPVEVVNEKGHEYAALVRKLLEEGTTNWENRLTDLDALQEDMEHVVAALKTSYDEIKQEKQLVGHLARLKKRPGPEDNVTMKFV